jgi:pimeloyl-ACP methyl ester carboxylesterase
VNLIGLSMGGAVITRFASAYPERVRSMLWVDSYGMVKSDDLLMRITRPQLVGEALIGTIGGFFLRRAPDRGVHEPSKHKDFNRWFAAPLAVSGSKRALLSTLRNFMLDDHVPHFRAVNELPIPKLMVWGRHDRILPLSYGEKLHGLVPSARFETFERSGHLPHFEEPERFNAMALSFLNDAAE